jgi:peptidoglycan/xylan/chitin deacetylase (PgdA/CDA1 family)
MWNGKLKAVTFSIDDGCASDKRIVELFNKYGIKGTFNINSGLLNTQHEIRNEQGKIVEVVPKMKAYEVKNVYQGHEVAVHTCTHPNLTDLEEKEIIYQVEEDRKTLSGLVGYDVIGMAYPCGGTNNDERVAKIIKENTPIRYARTITSTYSFDLQENLLQFNPTVYWIEKQLFDVVERFLGLKTDKPQLLYIWGHAFELDRGDLIFYEKLEMLCALLSKHDDLFFGTNREVFNIKYG